MGEQTNHQAVHVLVLRSPGQVLNAFRHVLDKNKQNKKEKHMYMIKNNQRDEQVSEKFKALEFKIVFNAKHIWKSEPVSW